MSSCSLKPQNSSCSGLPHSTALLSSQNFFSPSSYHCLCFYPRLQTHNTHTHTHTQYIHFPMSSVRARKATEEREVVRASPTLQLLSLPHCGTLRKLFPEVWRAHCSFPFPCSLHSISFPLMSEPITHFMFSFLSFLDRVGTWDPSSPTRDRTHTPCVGSAMS